MTTFGVRMRALMAERGISLRKLAGATYYDLGHLSRVSRDLKPPSVDLARAVDDALDADGELVALAPSRTRPWGVTDSVTPDDEERLLLAAQKPVRVDATVVESLSTILAAQRRTEDVIGSTPLLEPVRAQLATIEDLVTDARGPVRPQIVNVAGQWAQYLGWLHVSTGRLSAASAMLDSALEHAVETDDINLTSEVLGFKGHVAWESGQVPRMIGLRAAARRDDGRLFPGESAISAAQEARGHAVLGDARETDRLLDLADELAEQARARHDETPPWLYYQVDGFFELHAGQAWRYLGRSDPAYNRKAIDTLTAGLATLPADMRGSEWAGEFVYQLGRAFLQAGDREQAEVLAADLKALAERIGSRRLAEQAAALQ